MAQQGLQPGLSCKLRNKEQKGSKQDEVRLAVGLSRLQAASRDSPHFPAFSSRCAELLPAQTLPENRVTRRAVRSPPLAATGVMKKLIGRAAIGWAGSDRHRALWHWAIDDGAIFSGLSRVRSGPQKAQSRCQRVSIGTVHMTDTR